MHQPFVLTYRSRQRSQNRLFQVPGMNNIVGIVVIDIRVVIDSQNILPNRLANKREQ